MPTYVYAILNPDGSDGETFEIVQRMSDLPLTAHPVSRRPVRRVIQPPIIPGAGSDHATKKLLSDKNLDRLGFTKYQRGGGGTYEKKAGHGPRTISAD